ncbi:MAG: transcription termination factor NusA [Candidatus Peregrinibacteria bacterium]
MQNQQFIAALRQLCSEKNIEKELVMEAVESAIAAAYKKDYGSRDMEVRVELQEDAPELARIYLLKEVVEDDDVVDEKVEVSLEEAKQVNPEVELGDEVYIDVTPSGYGRIAAQSAKQVILQKVQEAERISLFQRFKDREGQLVTGSVNRVEGNHIFVDIEKTTVLLGERQRVPGEKYFPGRRMRLYLERVGSSAKGPQLLVSRTNTKLIEKLMEEEIPEIAHGEVEIVAISRDAGVRSKVAVRALDKKVDPVGTCIGQRGSRIHPIMDELSGERVDVIEWDDNMASIIARALQPAKVANVVIITDEEFIDEESGKRIKKRAAVFVDEEERAMAIGKRGQNIRLASELTGFELDMYNIEEYEAFAESLGAIQDGKK